MIDPLRCQRCGKLQKQHYGTRCYRDEAVEWMPSDLDPAVESMRRLVEQWRAKAQHLYQQETARAASIERCADELEALLAARLAPQPQENEEDKTVSRIPDPDHPSREAQHKNMKNDEEKNLTRMDTP